MTSHQCRLMVSSGNMVESLEEDQQPNAQAVGVVNSDINVEALTKYLDLLATMHPSHKTGGMGIFEMQALYLEGKIASMINWVGLGAPVVDPSLSKFMTLQVMQDSQELCRLMVQFLVGQT